MLILQNLVNIFPQVSRYHYALGNVQRWLGKDEESLESFRRAVATASPSRKFLPLASLADLLYDMDKIKDAKPLAMQALKEAPSDSWVVSTAAKILEKSGDLDRALEILLNALRRSPTDSHLHFRSGMILKNMGQFLRAKDYLEQTFSDPALALYSCTALADVYLLLGNDRKAEEVLEKIPGNKWNNPGYLSTKGNILRRRKEFTEAERVLKKALNLEQNNPIHYGGLARLKFEQAKNSISKKQKQLALVYINEAKTLLSNGLQRDKDNEGLLETKHAIEDFELTIGLK